MAATVNLCMHVYIAQYCTVPVKTTPTQCLHALLASQNSLRYRYYLIHHYAALTMCTVVLRMCCTYDKICNKWLSVSNSMSLSVPCN
jgi:hypothetical protein